MTLEIYHHESRITEMEEDFSMRSRTEVIPLVKISEDGEVMAGLEVYTVTMVIKVRDIEVVL